MENLKSFKHPRTSADRFVRFSPYQVHSQTLSSVAVTPSDGLRPLAIRNTAGSNERNESQIARQLQFLPSGSDNLPVKDEISTPVISPFLSQLPTPSPSPSGSKFSCTNGCGSKFSRERDMRKHVKKLLCKGNPDSDLRLQLAKFQAENDVLRHENQRLETDLANRNSVQEQISQEYIALGVRQKRRRRCLALENLSKIAVTPPSTRELTWDIVENFGHKYVREKTAKHNLFYERGGTFAAISLSLLASRENRLRTARVIFYNRQKMSRRVFTQVKGALETIEHHGVPLLNYRSTMAFLRREIQYIRGELYPTLELVVSPEPSVRLNGDGRYRSLIETSRRIISILLRNILMLLNKTEMTEEEVRTLETLCRYLQNVTASVANSSAYDFHNQAIWNLATIGPLHTRKIWKELNGKGLGLVSMQGREHLHQTVKKLLYTTNQYDRWGQVFEYHEIGSHFLPQQFNEVGTKYQKCDEVYVPQSAANINLLDVICDKSNCVSCSERAVLLEAAENGKVPSGYGKF